MKYKLLTATVAGVMAAMPALAELTFASLSYRTGAYASNGIPLADGYADYMTLLNERDGGIATKGEEQEKANRGTGGLHPRIFRHKSLLVGS